MINRRILCVDDDPNILSGFKRGLRKDFEVFTAEGGEAGLALIKCESEFAVIVSDMQMPGMNGVQFLEHAQKITPNSVRIMLTGNADQQTAINAINNGNIFRFLTKPCEIDNLTNALNSGIEQYRLVTAEKQLLNETLSSSLQVMVEILSMVNPTAFSHSNRVKKMVRNIAERIGIKSLWEVEIAAMLSQIGCITVDEEILQKISKCIPLGEKELHLFHQHPKVAHNLISRIPRMEMVAEIISNQNRRLSDETEAKLPTNLTSDSILSARVLKIVLDFDKLLVSGSLPHHAHKELSNRLGWYDQNILNSLKDLIDASQEEFVNAELNINELKPGMVLVRPVISHRGVLLLAAGQDVTLPLILRLINLSETDVISENVLVSVPLGIFQLRETEQNENNETSKEEYTIPNSLENSTFVT